MIVFPTDNLIIKDLNTYFLHIEKFLEHYQGFVTAGGVSFSAPSAAGVIFFDEYRFLNAEYGDKTESLAGAKAFRKIVQTAHTKNFNVSVFETELDDIYYWAHVSDAVSLYKDLKSEFTDIAALIKKMKSEKLTGYIEIAPNDKTGNGHIFFNNGMIMGSKKGSNPNVTADPAEADLLIRKASENSGLFHVFQIQLGQKFEEISLSTRPVKTSISEPEIKTKEKSDTRVNQDYLIEMLQQLLQMLEKIIKANKKIKIDFETLLKKIFMEKVDKYDFLDPFAAELIYESSRLKFLGKTSEESLVNGVIECAMELATRTGVHGVLIKNLAPWLKKYEVDLNRFNIKF